MASNPPLRRIFKNWLSTLSNPAYFWAPLPMNGGLMVRHVEKARGDPPRTGGDTTRIRTLTDWSPTMSLRDGLSREVDWMVGYLQRSEA